MGEKDYKHIESSKRAPPTLPLQLKKSSAEPGRIRLALGTVV